MLLGLKSDLSDKREVSYEEALTFAEERNMMYFEVSSKTQTNINEAAMAMVK